MKMKHLLLECYCSCDSPDENNPCYDNHNEIGIHCLQCKNFSYTKCPYEIAFSNKEGVVEKEENFIGFGGEMDVDDIEKRQDLIINWSQVCRSKINEAYDVYMKLRNQEKNDK